MSSTIFSHVAGETSITMLYLLRTILNHPCRKMNCDDANHSPTFDFDLTIFSAVNISPLKSSYSKFTGHRIGIPSFKNHYSHSLTSFLCVECLCTLISNMTSIEKQKGMERN